MKKKLVIVESPAKARTLSRILGKSYSLKASLGHVRDLPKSALGLDLEKDFTPKYVVPRVKSKIARELKDAAKDASAIYLATDPDREGEAISWHIAEVIKTDSKPLHRVVFHEITDEAIKNAVIHGNREDSAVLVTLKVYQADQDLWMVVSDEGDGFDPASVPDPCNDIGVLNESGRGLYLLQHYTKSLVFWNGGRTVALCFPLSDNKEVQSK